MMENRSFDHLLGGHPTSEALQQELGYWDRLIEDWHVACC